MVEEKEILLEKVRRLIEIGSALTSEGDLAKLLEKILFSAKEFTSADGGTLYTITPQKTLKAEISSSDSLQFHLGGTSKQAIPFAEIPLVLADGSPNDRLIAAHCAHFGKPVNIADAYCETGFDFSGPRLFDQLRGYRTKSVLALPLKNQAGEVLGILQLINAYHPESKKIIPFSKEDVYLAESLASEAGVALTNQRLLQDLTLLFESFVRTIAKTIDKKSPFTGNHSRRVPLIAEALARAVNETKEGPLKEVHLTEKEIYELKLAAFLHDCGKITTPVHIMEKHSHLETLFDRIELIATRMEVLKRDALVERLIKKLDWYEKRLPELQAERAQAFGEIDRAYDKSLGTLNQEMQFIEKCNHAPAITKEMAEEIERCATKVWTFKGALTSFLSPDEVENLTIAHGNLTDKERKIIENHVVETKNILSEIPFPKELRRVPEIASNHHERVDGKGYPKGLRKEEVSLQARILIVADVFEALSAPDRPYKEPLTLSQIYQILQAKVEGGHLDPDLVAIFLNKHVALDYAKDHLNPSQIDVGLPCATCR